MDNTPEGRLIRFQLALTAKNEMMMMMMMMMKYHGENGILKQLKPTQTLSLGIYCPRSSLSKSKHHACMRTSYAYLVVYTAALPAPGILQLTEVRHWHSGQPFPNPYTSTPSPSSDALVGGGGGKEKIVTLNFLLPSSFGGRDVMTS